MKRILVAAFLSLIAYFPASVSAADPKVYAFTRGSYSGPSTSELVVPVVTVPKGAQLYLFNLHLWGHSMVSDLNGRNDRLFWSEEVSFGKSTIVNGVAALPEGEYRFFCSNHPSMKGTLIIIGKEEL